MKIAHRRMCCLDIGFRKNEFVSIYANIPVESDSC